MLPMTPKMTWLDQLLVGSLMVMVLVSILVTLSAGAKSTQFDRLCLAISVLAVLGHSAYFACKARTASAFELKKLSSPEHRLLEEGKMKTPIEWVEEGEGEAEATSGATSGRDGHEEKAGDAQASYAKRPRGRRASDQDDEASTTL